VLGYRRSDSGEPYLDLGEHGHIGRNETDQPTQDDTVLFGPPGIAPGDFRIGMDAGELPVLD
jgi:hypothetical protein